MISSFFSATKLERISIERMSVLRSNLFVEVVTDRSVDVRLFTLASFILSTETVPLVFVTKRRGWWCWVMVNSIRCDSIFGLGGGIPLSVWIVPSEHWLKKRINKVKRELHCVCLSCQVVPWKHCRLQLWTLLAFASFIGSLLESLDLGLIRWKTSTFSLSKLWRLCVWEFYTRICLFGLFFSHWKNTPQSENGNCPLPFPPKNGDNDGVSVLSLSVLVLVGEGRHTWDGSLVCSAFATPMYL